MHGVGAIQNVMEWSEAGILELKTEELKTEEPLVRAAGRENLSTLMGA